MKKKILLMVLALAGVMSTQAETPTDITLSNDSFVENRPVTLEFGDGYFEAQPAGTYTFTLVPGAGSADNASFTIINGGEFFPLVQADYETKSSYSIRVRATDEGGLFYEKQFTINVFDVEPFSVLEDFGFAVMRDSTFNFGLDAFQSFPRFFNPATQTSLLTRFVLLPCLLMGCCVSLAFRWWQGRKLIFGPI